MDFYPDKIVDTDFEVGHLLDSLAARLAAYSAADRGAATAAERKKQSAEHIEKLKSLGYVE